jgi:hypothetical protein
MVPIKDHENNFICYNRCMNYPHQNYTKYIRKGSNFLSQYSNIDAFGCTGDIYSYTGKENIDDEYHVLQNPFFIGWLFHFKITVNQLKFRSVFLVLNFIKNEFFDIRYVGSIPFSYFNRKNFEPHLINVYYVDNLQKETILNQIVKILEKYPLYFLHNDDIYYKRSKLFIELDVKNLTQFEEQHPYKLQIEYIYDYHNYYSIARDIYPIIRQDFLDIKNAILNIKQVDSLMITCLKQLVCKDEKNEELLYLCKNFHIPHIEKYCKKLKEMHQIKVIDD